MKRIIIMILFVLIFFSCKHEKSFEYYVEGVSNPIIKLNGTWKFNIEPMGDFWAFDTQVKGWKDIQVPGECMMQGFAIKHDEPFAYKKRIEIPADYINKRIVLQFDGVYSYVRVWINGNFVRDHSGGFTRWDCDITPFVEPGETALLTVEVTDKVDEISYGSGYALHLIGGILRDVHLLALPKTYPHQVSIATDFDDDYKNAMLTINGKLTSKVTNARLELRLTDKDNKNILLENSIIDLNNTNSFTVENPVISPLKWDAEHPNLYKLTLSYFKNDKLLYSKVYQIGFREIEVMGNKFLVNGMEIKLRGACRHDIHPVLGRVSTPEYEQKDVLLAKEANINFIRASHYPPTENFLRLCDEYGIYVEDETAVCFANTWRRKEYFPGATENDPAYTDRYLSQLEEMIVNHRNHPSIILWSIGNENKFGENFKKSYDLVKENDKTRPVIFSYSGYAPDSIKAYDVLSIHYPSIKGDKEEFGIGMVAFKNDEMPVLSDEWAHNACYNFRTIKEDPNVRDFWGQSLDSMWTNVFDADGGLGGAIWGMIDETFMLPDTLSGFNEWWGIDVEPSLQKFQGHTVGSGEWGMIDTWRRKKPEFWHTKKAYSPFKVLQTELDGYKQGGNLSVPVYNRYNHTNFNELTIKYTYQNREGILDVVDIKPHTKGTLSIPIKNLKPNEFILLEAFDRNNALIDKYKLRLKIKNQIKEPDDSSGEISLIEDEDQLTIICENNTRIVFDKISGMIKEVQKPSGNFSFSGPHLNLRIKGKPIDYMRNHINEYVEDWTLIFFSYKREKNRVIVSVKGNSSKLSMIDFEITIEPTGQISTKYKVEKIPSEYIREIGIRFDSDNNIDSLSWERDTYWSYYPTNHLSASKGTVTLYSNISNVYRKAPE
ncbi:MAG: beta-galactosidase, partial [Bacteroidales bacterium]|nr:beta-galactosidase [Bacteroidales bacterium]